MADIHSNHGALQACLAHAAERGAARFALLGDFIGYSAEPGAVVREVARLSGPARSRSRAITTRASRIPGEPPGT